MAPPCDSLTAIVPPPGPQRILSGLYRFGHRLDVFVAWSRLFIRRVKTDETVCLDSNCTHPFFPTLDPILIAAPQALKKDTEMKLMLGRDHVRGYMNMIIMAL
jgi:hypothetical protein